MGEIEQKVHPLNGVRKEMASLFWWYEQLKVLFEKKFYSSTEN